MWQHKMSVSDDAGIVDTAVVVVVELPRPLLVVGIDFHMSC